MERRLRHSGRSRSLGRSRAVASERRHGWPLATSTPVRTTRLRRSLLSFWLRGLWRAMARAS
eukprot:9153110-Lingulodinium_polyedra.AAC.1